MWGVSSSAIDSWREVSTRCVHQNRNLISIRSVSEGWWNRVFMWIGRFTEMDADIKGQFPVLTDAKLFMWVSRIHRSYRYLSSMKLSVPSESNGRSRLQSTLGSRALVLISTNKQQKYDQWLVFLPPLTTLLEERQHQLTIWPSSTSHIFLWILVPGLKMKFALNKNLQEIVNLWSTSCQGVWIYTHQMFLQASYTARAPPIRVCGSMSSTEPTSLWAHPYHLANVGRWTTTDILDSYANQYWAPFSIAEGLKCLTVNNVDTIVLSPAPHCKYSANIGYVI